MSEGRPTCPRCRRPLEAHVPGTAAPVAGVCFCDRIVQMPTRTRVLLLQHPRERRVGVGTARLAHLALPGSALRVGVDFSSDPLVQEALREPTPTCVLFPGPTSRPAQRLEPGARLNLIVLDGTWSNARRLLAANPALAALPRMSFQPRRPSDYGIRRQPAPFCVSTIEALAEVLALLEPEGGPFERLLDPFLAMVERQRWFQREVRANRHRARPGPGPRGRLAARLAADWPRWVCVQGEANAWPRRDPGRQDPETVHWLAHRPASGETFEAVVAPRRPLAPSTPAHVGLAAGTLLGGETAESWRARWGAFLRPEDRLVVWGSFYRGLAASEGLALPATALDLRLEASRALRRRLGTVEECLATLQAAGAALGRPGRGGRRLEALVGALIALRGPADTP
jgi:DTW domain-containing protein YfiP